MLHNQSIIYQDTISVVTFTKTTSKAAPTSSVSPDSSDPENGAEVFLDADLDDFMDLPLYSRIAQEEDTPLPVC